MSADTDASYVDFRAWRGGDDGAVLAVGCVATPIPGWVEDMRPPVVARTIALAGATAERATGLPMDAAKDGDRVVLRAASRPNDPPLGEARTFVGFDASRVLTCFAVCAAPPPPRDALGCETAVRATRLEATDAPPAPGVALRAVTWAVHHPRPTAATFAGAVALFALVALVTRRRPRFR